MPSDQTRLLGHLMAAGAGGESLWEPDELAGILRHQLAAPLDFDLSRVDEEASRQATAWDAASPGQGSFGDLLRHPRPPLELLEAVKRFAKASRGHPDHPLPDEIATVLYLLAIAAALVKHGVRLTRLDDEALRPSIEWALAQPWLDPLVREVLTTAMGNLKVL